MIRLPLLLSAALVANALAGPARADDTVRAAVPVHRINAGDIITKADLQDVDVPERQLRPDSLTKTADIVGLQARRALLPGRVVSSLAIGQAILVERNKRASASYRDGGLELNLPVVALDNGTKGDTVRVTNPGNGNVLYATVVGPGEVAVPK